MANIIEVRKTIDSFGTLDKSVTFSSPLQLPQYGTLKMQVCSVTLSDRIPNIFNASPYYSFNNATLLVATNIEPWQRINLQTGLYQTADTIAAAINNAMGLLPVTAGGTGWWINNADPGVTFSPNSIIDKMVANLDASKLKPAAGNRFYIDLTLNGVIRPVINEKAGTSLGWTLGYSDANAVWSSNVSPSPTSLWTSDMQVHMDVQGTSCDIHCSLVSTRRRNDTFVQTIALIPFAGKNTISDNVWPSGGQISPVLVYDGLRNIPSVVIEPRTLDNKPMLFMSGTIHIIISFIY